MSICTRVLVASVLATALFAMPGCSETPEEKTLDLETTAELNGVWSLNAIYKIICGGVPEQMAVTNHDMYFFNGDFEDLNVPLPAAVCGVGTVRFEGAADLQGELFGNFSTNGGNPVLADTFSGSCKSVDSCKGSTDTSALFSFSLARTSVDLFDGAWTLSGTCNGSSMFFMNTLTIASGALSGTANSFGNCGMTGIVNHSATVQQALTGTIEMDGSWTATLAASGEAEAVSLSGVATSITQIAGSGPAGVAVTGTRPVP